MPYVVKSDQWETEAGRQNPLHLFSIWPYQGMEGSQGLFGSYPMWPKIRYVFSTKLWPAFPLNLGPKTASSH